MSKVILHMLDGLTMELDTLHVPTYTTGHSLPPNFLRAVRNDPKLNPPYDMDLLHIRRYELMWQVPLSERQWVSVWGGYNEVHP